MTPKEVIHVIVDTELSASSSYNDALKKQEGFDDYIAGRRETLRREYMQKSDEAINEARSRETASADAAVVRLDEKLHQNLGSAKKYYEAHREELIDKIFAMVVNLDA